ncbi:MAG: Methylmalonyl-CoA carboxyltransferase 12S subunit [Bacteroidetes bacterium MED-G17]|nr:MAG: Methylmalonyl-CoA carboxyltransferase 12S subunit [Bacteroidetes bacterium MED-G17]
MDLELNKNEDHNRLELSKLKKLKTKIALGGGKKSAQKQKDKGKLLARERINYLKDEEADFFEIGSFAANEMYKEYGEAPAAGVVGGITKVSGKWCVVVANDPTVKAGAWFPMTGKKNLRFQEIAMENRIPIIYLVDSAGVFLPMQNEIFADKEHFGRIFRNNAKMSSMGITQIAAVMGSCVAGGAYLPIMSDDAIIVEKTGSIFLAGSYLVKAAIGEDIDNENLGGSKTQTDVSGVIDDRFPSEEKALDRIKYLMGQTNMEPKTTFERHTPIEPKLELSEIYRYLPIDRTKTYETKKLIEVLVDDSRFEEYKANYGKTIICAWARIEGYNVGIVANNRQLVKSAKGEMQVGGVIYSDSADKAARFIMNCNQKKIPLVFLHDVTGFMVGSRSEQGGIIKDGAKMVNAVSNSTVPKFSVIIGNSYGAGNYAMCGKAFDPRFIVAWPSAKVAVMGGEQAAKTLLQIEKSRLNKQGKQIDEKEEKNLLNNIISKYDAQTTPIYAASQLWVDEIIDPIQTRKWLYMGIELASFSNIESFNVGILQT